MMPASNGRESFQDVLQGSSDRLRDFTASERSMKLPGITSDQEDDEWMLWAIHRSGDLLPLINSADAGPMSEIDDLLDDFGQRGDRLVQQPGCQIRMQGQRRGHNTAAPGEHQASHMGSPHSPAAESGNFQDHGSGNPGYTGNISPSSAMGVGAGSGNHATKLVVPQGISEKYPRRLLIIPWHPMLSRAREDALSRARSAQAQRWSGAGQNQVESLGALLQLLAQVRTFFLPVDFCSCVA